MNQQLKTNFKLLFTSLLLFPIFHSCNNSINKNNPSTSTMDSENSKAVIDNVIFKTYDQRTKEFIPSRESQLKYNAQGGTIEANYFRLYSNEKSLWSHYKAKFSENMMTEYTVERGDYFRKTKHEFNARGKVLSTIYLDRKSGKFIPTSREIFEWNDSMLVSHKTCSSMENECNENFEQKHEYDSMGRKVSVVSIPNGEKDTVRYFYNDSSPIPIKVTKIPYDYDILTKNGKVIEIKKSYYNHYSQRDTIEKATTIKYDKKERVILIKQETEHETELNEYLYDDRDNLSEIKYSSKTRSGLDQTKWVFEGYKEYQNFVTPAWFVEAGLFWLEPKFTLNKFINQLSFENVNAKVITSKTSFPSGYIEYWSKGKDRVDWVPYQKVEYNVTELN